MSKRTLEDPETTAQRRGRLDALRQEIQGLEDRLSQLKKEEVRQSYELQQLCLKNSPINSISDDILREVFLHTLPTGREQALSTHPRPFKVWESPLLLRRICKNWKDIAENCSLLWTTFQLYVSEEAARGVKPNRTMLKRWSAAWLRLTKNSHLHLHLVSHADNETLLASILPPSAYGRLTRLSLGGASVSYPLIASLACGENVAFPVLEELIIGAFYEEPIWMSRRPIKVFEKCPRLQRAIVGRIPYEDHSPMITLPWHQLTHFIVLFAVPLQLYTKVMKECPLLRFVYMVPEYVNLERHSELPKTTWNWPNLSNITFNFWYSTRSGPFFPVHLQHLHLEKLESFRLVAPEFTLDPSDDVLFQNSLKSMKALQHLSLCFSAIDDLGYTDTFQHLPQLKTLDIQLHNLPDRDHDPFKILIANPAMLPNLTKVIIDIGPIWGQRFSMGTLAAFIEARACSPTGKGNLQQVVIYIPIDLSRTKGALSMEGLDKLRSRNPGVGIDIRHVREQRLNMEDISSWVERDEELVNSWPEARYAFVTSHNIDNTVFFESSEEDSE